MNFTRIPIGSAIIHEGFEGLYLGRLKGRWEGDYLVLLPYTRELTMNLESGEVAHEIVKFDLNGQLYGVDPLNFTIDRRAKSIIFDLECQHAEERSGLDLTEFPESLHCKICKVMTKVLSIKKIIYEKPHHFEILVEEV